MEELIAMAFHLLSSFFFFNFIMKRQLTQQPHTLNNMPAVMVSLKTTYSQMPDASEVTSSSEVGQGQKQTKQLLLCHITRWMFTSMGHYSQSWRFENCSRVKREILSYGSQLDFMLAQHHRSSEELFSFMFLGLGLSMTGWEYLCVERNLHLPARGSLHLSLKHY